LGAMLVVSLISGAPMKKLKLMLDELAVETFETVKPIDRRGTVIGADSSAGPHDCQFACGPTEQCPSHDCFFTDDCIYETNDSCACLSIVAICPDTGACPEVTSSGETC
jgi:hypothetical protein